MPNSPYTPQSTPATYNSSPPADDGSAVASNQIDWSKIKTKIGDALDTFCTNIDSALQTAFGKVPNLDADEQNTFQGVVAFTSSELTIASGSITATRTHHTVDTESDAATDDLDTIAVGSVPDGAVLYLGQNNASRDVTVKHGTGNIFLQRGGDYTLDDSNHRLELIRDGANWYEVGQRVAGQIVQAVHTTSGTLVTGTTTIPNDDTIPQNTEGVAAPALDTEITPTNTTNRLLVECFVYASNDAAEALAIALFQDSTAGALATGYGHGFGSSQGDPGPLIIRHEMAAGTVSATTFKVRIGATGAGTTSINGTGGVAKHGGVLASHIRVTELTS